MCPFSASSGWVWVCARSCGAAFQAFETHCKVDSGGYSGLRNVNSGVPPKGDQMQSYFLAETLKYLYLLFSDSSVLPLDVWVLNTEAHPLRIQCV
jgi:hypothetical protein